MVDDFKENILKSEDLDGYKFKYHFFEYVDENKIPKGKIPMLYFGSYVNYFGCYSEIKTINHKVNSTYFNVCSSSDGKFYFNIIDGKIVEYDRIYDNDFRVNHCPYNKIVNIFQPVSDLIEGFLKSPQIKKYNKYLENDFLEQFNLLDKSKLLVNTKSSKTNKYINIQRLNWYNTNYKEYKFTDEEFERIKLEEEYSVIRNYSGFYNYNLDVGVCKLIDEEDNIALFDRVDDKCIYIPRSIDYDIIKYLNNYRRVDKISKVIG